MSLTRIIKELIRDISDEIEIKRMPTEIFNHKKAKIISKDNKFRISLSDYSSKELANQGKKELSAKFKGAWIMPF